MYSKERNVIKLRDFDSAYVMDFLSEGQALPFYGTTKRQVAICLVSVL